MKQFLDEQSDIFLVLSILTLCYVLWRNTLLRKKIGSIRTADDIEKFYKKGVYLKLVTTISEVQYNFKKHTVRVYGFEIGTLNPEKGFESTTVGLPIEGNIFFELTTGVFYNGAPQEGCIYKVVKECIDPALKKYLYVLKPAKYRDGNITT